MFKITTTGGKTSNDGLWGAEPEHGGITPRPCQVRLKQAYMFTITSIVYAMQGPKQILSVSTGLPEFLQLREVLISSDSCMLKKK